jgi:hypothetical protein
MGRTPGSLPINVRKSRRTYAKERRTSATTSGRCLRFPTIVTEVPYPHPGSQLWQTSCHKFVAISVPRLPNRGCQVAQPGGGSPNRDDGCTQPDRDPARSDGSSRSWVPRRPSRATAGRDSQLGQPVPQPGQTGRNPEVESAPRRNGRYRNRWTRTLATRPIAMKATMVDDPP